MSSVPRAMRRGRPGRSTRAPTNGTAATPANANIEPTSPMPAGPACRRVARILGSSRKIENAIPNANCSASSSPKDGARGRLTSRGVPRAATPS